jgi:hypothetical protein
VAARVHKHLCIDLWCVLFEHQRCVEDRDRLKSKREAAPESKELQINLRELNVEFTEVTDVVHEQSFAEVRLNKLVLQRVFVRSKQVLESVKSDLIFLDVRINQYHAFDAVVYTVAHEVKLKKELFSKHEPKVRLAEQLVDEWVISPHQLVLDVLQNAAEIGHREDLVFALILHLFVYLVIKRKVFHRRHLVIRPYWLAEL